MSCLRRLLIAIVGPELFDSEAAANAIHEAIQEALHEHDS